MLLYNKALTSICLLQFIFVIYAQGPPVFSNSNKVNSYKLGQQDALQLTQGAEKFCLEFFKQISDAHITAPNRSFMISPFAVWSLLLLLTEGSADNTLQQLRTTLHTGNDQHLVRTAYHIITKYLTVNTTTVEVATFNALFTNINKPVSKDYEDIIERDYGSVLIPVNFDDVNNTYTKINQDIRKATRDLIPYTVIPQDFKDANILMISSLYFKGKWKYPFEASKTQPLPFHDEEGKILGDVPMMTQMGLFTYTNVRELEAHVLELPYGKENRLSMLVILPRRGIKLNKVVRNLQAVGLRHIQQQLLAAAQYYTEEEDKPEVEVFLPKFATESHFTLRPILRNMGIEDLFDAARSRLDKISRDSYVSSIIHATRIIVNEEGTEAGAVVSAILVNKASPTRFFVDRPFAYLIVEKTANVLLFAGEVRSNV